MTLSELEKEITKYIAEGYGDSELKTIDQGGNDGEVLEIYKTPSGKIIIEAAGPGPGPELQRGLDQGTGLVHRTRSALHGRRLNLPYTKGLLQNAYDRSQRNELTACAVMISRYAP